jgi:hypothetical protein
MPLVELPNGQSAIIKNRADVSERIARLISRAFMNAASSAMKLSELGFDETKPETWTTYAQLSESDKDNLDLYQSILIESMVQSWTLGDLPTQDSALDLPKATFDALALACSNEFNDITDFSPDGAINPKAPIAN